MTEVEYDRSCVGCETRRIHRQADEVSYILSSLPASSPLRVATGADSEVSRARTRSITSHDIPQMKSLLTGYNFEGVSTVLQLWYNFCRNLHPAFMLMFCCCRCWLFFHILLSLFKAFRARVKNWRGKNKTETRLKNVSSIPSLCFSALRIRFDSLPTISTPTLGHILCAGKVPTSTKCLYKNCRSDTRCDSDLMPKMGLWWCQIYFF